MIRRQFKERHSPMGVSGDTFFAQEVGEGAKNMLTPRRMAVALAGAVCLSFATLADAAAQGCPSLPHVSWWDTSPEKIVRYVDQAFQGEWDPYIARWEDYRFRMAKIHEANGAAVVRSRNLRLEGDALAT